MARWITAAEFKSAPTAVDTGSLVYGGNSAAQDAQLVAVIERASAMCDNLVNGPSSQVASERTWTSRVRIAPTGDIMFHPGCWPISSVQSISIGYSADSLVAVSSSSIAAGWVDTAQRCFILPGGATFVAPSTPIQIGGWRGTDRVLMQVNYTAGYPSTWITQTATAGQFHVHVAETAGIVAGTVLTIADGANTETVTVTSTPTTNQVATTALAFTHTFVAGDVNQIAVHAMPHDMRLAAVYVTASLIKTRGNDSLVMGQLMTPAPQVGIDPVTSSNIRMARDLLAPYRRVR